MKIRRLKSSPAGIAAGRPPARTRAFACAGRRPSAGAQLIAPLLHGLARSDFNRGDF